METLPNELIVVIYAVLSPRDACRFSLAAHMFYALRPAILHSISKNQPVIAEIKQIEYYYNFDINWCCVSIQKYKNILRMYRQGHNGDDLLIYGYKTVSRINRYNKYINHSHSDFYDAYSLLHLEFAWNCGKEKILSLAELFK